MWSIGGNRTVYGNPGYNRRVLEKALPYGKKNEEAGKFVKMIYELTD
jgi:hypothetical protein